MFKLDSEAALIKAFRPKDQKTIELSPDLAFPLIVTDYLAWTHPAGGRVFLVFAAPKGVATGISFDSNGGATDGVSQMCDWCHCSGQGTGIAMLTAKLNARKRIGVYLCADLGCGRKLEDDANRSGQSVRPRMEKLVARMARFASEGLQIDLTGTRR